MSADRPIPAPALTDPEDYAPGANEIHEQIIGSFCHDLRQPLRDGATDEEVGRRIAEIWRAREDRYSELRSQPYPSTRKVEMSYIGG